MEKDSNGSVDPLNLGIWEDEARDIAIRENFSGFEIDAFRHAYVNAMITWKYGTAAGILYADGLGIAYEASGLLLTLGHDAWAALTNPFGNDITPYGISGEAKASVMDIYNNNVGVMIGSSATSKDDIIAKVASAVRSGMVITSPNTLEDEQRKRNPPGNSFRQGEWDWMKKQDGSTPDRHLYPFGRTASGQPVIPTSFELARGIKKSRRWSLENDLMEIFSDSDRHRTPPYVPGGSNTGRGGTPPLIPDGSGPNIGGMLVSKLVDRVLESAFGGKTRTRTSSAESSRSIEERERWRLSRSQQQAMLARQAQQGARNL